MLITENDERRNSYNREQVLEECIIPRTGWRAFLALYKDYSKINYLNKLF